MFLLHLSILASLFGSINGGNRPPVIRCPRVKAQYTADSMRTSTTVTWDPPTAISYRYRPLRVYLKTGKGSGSRFEQGTHTVIYQANDNGLKDFCIFTFTVAARECPLLANPANSKGFTCSNARKVGSICVLHCDVRQAQERNQFTMCSADQTWTNLRMKCQALRCDPPKMDDQYLETPGCVDYREGRSCTLQCYLDLQLVGPRVITCKKDGSSTKGYWSYGQRDSPPAEKPYCKVHNCTELRAPDHGAISCDKWHLGRTCSISCHQHYDIPESVPLVSSVYFCNRRTGRWNNDHVPDCAWRKFGEKIRMTGYDYFHGSCLESTPEIKSNFLNVIDVGNLCPRKKLCTVENVRVRCDETEDSW